MVPSRSCHVFLKVGRIAIPARNHSFVMGHCWKDLCRGYLFRAPPVAPLPWKRILNSLPITDRWWRTSANAVHSKWSFPEALDPAQYCGEMLICLHVDRLSSCHESGYMFFHVTAVISHTNSYDSYEHLIEPGWLSCYLPIPTALSTCTWSWGSGDHRDHHDPKSSLTWSDFGIFWSFHELPLTSVLLHTSTMLLCLFYSGLHPHSISHHGA